MGNSVSAIFPAYVRNMAPPFWHLTAGILEFYALWYDQKYVNVKFSEDLHGYPFKNRILFLTMWNLSLQAVYMSVAFLNDLIGTNEPSPEKTPTIRRIKDAIFSTAYPSAMYVSCAFWALYSVEKELVFPQRYRRAYPFWLNQTMHTLVAVFLNIEMFSTNITYPSQTVNLFFGFLLMLSYTAWLFIVYFQTGAWVYPILGYLNWPSKMLLVITNLTISHLLNVFGMKLNRRLSDAKCKSK